MKRTLVMLAIILIAATSFAAQTPDSSARIDQVVQEYVKAGAFMGTVLVARDGQIVFSNAYGAANVGKTAPNTLETRFRIGSLTKQFTAAAILVLEQRGKLSTTDLVKKYLPDAPAAWNQITVAHLLTHTSGIPNFTSFPEYAEFSRQPNTPQQLIDRFRGKPLDFAPGTEMRYSNSGYVLLGYIVEKASGMPYAKFLDENIFKPLEMKDSGYETSNPPIPNLAQGYARGSSGPEVAQPLDMTVPFAAGGLYSTVTDLLRWEQALFGNKLLSAASLQKLTTPAKNEYAFGLVISSRAGQRVIEHNGGINGFNSKLAYYPADKVTVVALSNINGNGADQIVDTIGALVHGEAVVLPSERKEVQLPPEVLKQYVGSYEMRPGFDFVMAVKDGQLTISPTGQSTDVLYAESKDHFFSKRIDARIEFGRDDSGAVTHLVLHQGAFNGKALKKE
ncbi:MAG: serine hydrolase [Pseudomonadota bacterium]